MFAQRTAFFAFLIAANYSLAVAQVADASAASGVPRTIAEKIVATIPASPLYWTVRSFDSLAQANQAAGEYGLAAQSDGRTWLFTLGPKSGNSSSGNAVVEVGPITPPLASRFLLRINEVISPPGRATPVHSHPGSEAFYVLKGEIQYKTAMGTFTVAAGKTDVGPPPNTVMQATTLGAVPAHNLVMFVLDADKPAQSPASF